MSVSLSWLDEGEVDAGFAGFGDDAGEGVETGVENDLDDLGVAVTGGLQRADIVVADRGFGPHQLAGKAHRGFGLRIVGGAAAVGGDLGVIEPDAIAGAVDVQ
jgi:hypothetical protein